MSKIELEGTRFVLLTTQRSGSTFIRLFLNSHPNVRCHSEIFLRKYPAADGFKSYCEANKGRRLLYYTLGKRKFAKLSYNFAMKWIICWTLLNKFTLGTLKDLLRGSSLRVQAMLTLSSQRRSKRFSTRFEEKLDPPLTDITST